MEKLPEAFKQKWIAALRSGKYTQGVTYLFNKDTNSYCCLGVAGAICGVPNYKMDGICYFSIHDGNVPQEYPKTLIDGHPKELKPTTGDLMGLNDSGKSFSEIADYIEENL